MLKYKREGADGNTCLYHLHATLLLTLVSSLLNVHATVSDEFGRPSSKPWGKAGAECSPYSGFLQVTSACFGKLGSLEENYGMLLELPM